MKNEFNWVRITCVSPKVIPADIDSNFAEIKKSLQEVDNSKSEVVIFPELCTCGYTCADLLLSSTLLNSVEIKLKNFLTTNTHDGVIILGAPIAVNQLIFNCAIVIQQQKILGIVPKEFLPNYKEFYEARWFESGKDFPSITSINYCDQEVSFGCDILFQSIDNKSFIFGVELCEDLWTPEPPSVRKSLNGAVLICNISASNAVVGKQTYRRNMVTMQSGRCLMAYAYCSAGVGESTTDTVFGGNCMIAENGRMLAENKGFERHTNSIHADIDVNFLIGERQGNKSYNKNAQDYYESSIRKILFNSKSLDYSKELPLRIIDRQPFIPSSQDLLGERCEEIFSIQTNALATRLERINCRNVVIGLSGGLDSTLALLVILQTYKILGWSLEGIKAITMPGFGTTSRTLNNVINLCQELNLDLRNIDITSASLQHMENIGHDPKIHDVTYENVQARERTQILMSIANKCGGIVIGTGDLSEIALGWNTYNGDHMSMYAVNCGVPKTLIIHLVRYIISKSDVADKVKKLLNDILETPISPELLPPNSNGEICQKTEDLIGPYEVHDFYLYYLIRCGYTPSKVLYLATFIFKNDHTEEQLKGWLKLFITRFWRNQFKRSCTPDGPKVGTISLSPRADWRMPSDASCKIWLDDLED